MDRHAPWVAQGRMPIPAVWHVPQGGRQALRCASALYGRMQFKLEGI